MNRGGLFPLLIFDLDGTLVDSRRDLAFSVNRTLVDMGLSTLPDETIYGYVGNGISRLISDAVLGADPALLEKAHKIFEGHYFSHLTDQTSLYPGMDAVLDYYRDKQKVVVTNKRAKFTRKILENLGVLQCFERILCADEVGALKPDPKMLINALQQLNRPAAKAVVIGDMENDIKAARAAGVPVCAVGYGFGEAQALQEAKPDFFAATVESLMTLRF